MNFLRKSWYCARTAYTSWILSYRMLVLGFVFMFMFTYFIKPMQDLSRIFDTPMNVLEPFCAVVNSDLGLAIGARHITISTCGIVPRALFLSRGNTN